MEQYTEKNDWMNEHGEPDFTYLHALAKDGGPQAIEKLMSIAEDMDVDYSENDSTDILVEKIQIAAAANEAVDPIMTS